VFNGTVSGFVVWHASHQAVTGAPPKTLTLDRLTVRGDVSALDSEAESPVGVWVSNYVSKNIAVTNADVQGMRVGVLSPFFYNQTAEAGRSGSLLIENSVFRNHIGLSVATGYVSPGGALKEATVRNSLFEPISSRQLPAKWPVESISMNYGMRPGDAQPRDPIAVYSYNRQPGNNFKVYYSYEAPQGSAPCHESLPGIGGWVCKQ
jgi:hypothetical protein